LNWKRESWIKLYVREAPEFAALPCYVRGYAAELMKFVTDDDGKLPSAEILMRAMGMAASDRRLFPRALVLLGKVGYLTSSGDGFRIRNFREAQGRTEKSQPNRERTANEPATNRERTSHEISRTVNEPQTRSEVSARDDLLHVARGEENRGEERRGERVAAEVSEFDVKSMGSIAWFRARFESEWSNKYGLGRPKPPNEIDLVRKFIEDNRGPALDAIVADFPGIVKRYLANGKEFLAKQKHPIRFLLADIAEYSGGGRKGPTVALKPSDMPEFDRKWIGVERPSLASAK